MFYKNRYSQYFDNDQVVKDIYFRESGWESCLPGHSCIGLIRDFYLLHFVASGKGTFHFDNKVSELEAGDGFIIFPGEVTAYYAHNQDPWEYCWFGVAGPLVPELLAMAGLDVERTFRLPDISLIKKVEELHRGVLESANPSLTGTGHAIIILNKLIEALGENKRVMTRRDYVRAAVNYIEYNYNRDITVAGIAREISLNRSHFYRVFYNEIGVSPQEYLINCRMNNARRLLENTELSIKEIANAVGYQDSANFSKIFTQRFGISPGKFRLSLKG